MNQAIEEKNKEPVLKVAEEDFVIVHGRFSGNASP